MQGAFDSHLPLHTRHIKRLLWDCLAQLEEDLPEVHGQRAANLYETTSDVLHELIRAFTRYEDEHRSIGSAPSRRTDGVCGS